VHYDLARPMFHHVVPLLKKSLEPVSAVFYSDPGMIKRQPDIRIIVAYMQQPVFVCLLEKAPQGFL